MVCRPNSFSVHLERYLFFPHIFILFSGDVRFSGPRVGGSIPDRARILLGLGEDKRGQAGPPRAPENVQVRDLFGIRVHVNLGYRGLACTSEHVQMKDLLGLGSDWGCVEGRVGLLAPQSTFQSRVMVIADTGEGL